MSGGGKFSDPSSHVKINYTAEIALWPSTLVEDLLEKLFIWRTFFGK